MYRGTYIPHIWRYMVNVYPSHLPTIVFINEILITVYAVKIADV